MKNNDLISRAEAIAVVRSMTVFLGGEQIFHPEAKQSVLNALNDISDIDAEPVRHGNWVHCNGKSNLWYCSECGEKIIYNPTRRTYKIEKLPVYAINKRCRNCGAKMDAEVKG